jgi:hypothetical protein
MLLFALLPLLLCGSLCGLTIGAPIYMNNLRLEKFAENLYNYPLPPETTVLTQYAEVDKVGNGNNCSYMAQQKLVSALSREEVEEFYQHVMFPRISLGSWGNIYDGSAEIPLRLSFDEVESDVKQTNFTLTLYDMGLDNTLDVRCH